MNWLAKSIAFKVLSAIPGGGAVYRFSQERITKSLVPTRERVSQKIDVGLRYWRWLKDNGRTDALDGAHVDFGAGWHPTIPLLFYSLGVNSQYLFDVTPQLTAGLLADTIRIFREIVTAPGWPDRAELRRVPEVPRADAQSLDEMVGQLGITHAAPYEPMRDKLRGAIALVTSTQVLYYISRSDLAGVFALLHSLMKSGGIFLATVHLKDTLADSDPGISPYNHLKFSPWFWERVVNSALMSVNRLKAPDYRELLENAGFKIVHFDVQPPTSEDLRELEKIPIHPCFAKYSKQDLGAKHLFFAAVKP
jgi:methyltransferase family protein